MVNLSIIYTKIIHKYRQYYIALETVAKIKQW